MKKSLLLFFGIATFASASLLAQPILTAAACNPVSGNVENIVNSSALSPGSAGANQTWNLAAMSGTVTPTTYTTPASTPYAAAFPSANLSTMAGANVYAYYKTSATAYQYYGLATTTNVKTIYSNPEDLIRFPFSYTNTYTDAYVAVTTNTASPNSYRRGSTTVTADAYGTLTTPAGTFGGVMRVHFVQNYQDSANYSGTPFVTTYSNDEYMWYLNGNHIAIAAVFTLTTNFGGSPSVSSGGSYLNNVVVGIEEQSSQLNSVSVFPNPAINHVNLSVNLTESQKVDIKLFNSLGAQVNATVSAEGIVGANDFKIDLSTLPEGIYFAQIHLDGNLSTTRRFVVSK
jgi:hypothetical protein